ncbi:MAG: DUF6056 family protein [Oscillospiraceae bacterium]|nr:DUF6056 family protein [Oscillospiraceae bacterium]
MAKLKPFLLPIGFLAAFLLLHQFVFLYEDDFYYGVVAQGSLRSFIDFHIAHYQFTNGRVLVHIFSTGLLYFDVYLWRIVNPFLLFGAIFFAAKCASLPLGIDSAQERSKWTIVLVSTAALFLSLPIALTRETFFWLSGALNYLYPMLMFFLGYHFFAKELAAPERKMKALPLLTFLAAATMEQIGLMFGVALFACFGAHLLLKKGSVTWVHLVSLGTATLGMMTVVFAPGLQNRHGFEGVPLSPSSLARTFLYFFTSPVSRFVILLFTVSVIAVLLYLFWARHRSKRWRLLLDGGALLALFVFLVLLLINDASWRGEPRMAFVFLFSCAAAIGAVAYVLLLFFFHTGQIAPLAFFLAAGAGQVVSAMADVHFNRMYFGSLVALLPAIVILLATVATHLEFSKTHLNVAKRHIFAVGFVLLCLFGLYQYGATLHGYVQNREVQLQRVAMVTAMREHQTPVAEEVFFAPLPNIDFAFEQRPRSLSSWYMMFYMQYYRISDALDLIVLADSRSYRLFLNGQQVESPNLLIRRDGALYLQSQRLVTWLDQVGDSAFTSAWVGGPDPGRFMRDGVLLFSHPGVASHIYLHGNLEESVWLSAPILQLMGWAYLPVEVLEKGFGFPYTVEANALGGYDVWVLVE